MTKLWRKLKWLVFFWDTVYIHEVLCLVIVNVTKCATKCHKYQICH